MTTYIVTQTKIKYTNYNRSTGQTKAIRQQNKVKETNRNRKPEQGNNKDKNSKTIQDKHTIEIEEAFHVTTHTKALINWKYCY